MSGNGDMSGVGDGRMAGIGARVARRTNGYGRTEPARIERDSTMGRLLLDALQSGAQATTPSGAHPSPSIELHSATLIM